MISESAFAAILMLLGVVVLCFCSIVLALKVRGDKVITWRGFGVTFTVCPCRECPVVTKVTSNINN